MAAQLPLFLESLRAFEVIQDDSSRAGRAHELTHDLDDQTRHLTAVLDERENCCRKSSAMRKVSASHFTDTVFISMPITALSVLQSSPSLSTPTHGPAQLTHEIAEGQKGKEENGKGWGKID